MTHLLGLFLTIKIVAYADDIDYNALDTAINYIVIIFMAILGLLHAIQIHDAPLWHPAMSGGHTDVLCSHMQRAFMLMTSPIHPCKKQPASIGVSLVIYTWPSVSRDSLSQFQIYLLSQQGSSIMALSATTKSTQKVFSYPLQDCNTNDTRSILMTPILAAMSSNGRTHQWEVCQHHWHWPSASSAQLKSMPFSVIRCVWVYQWLDRMHLDSFFIAMQGLQWHHCK